MGLYRPSGRCALLAGSVMLAFAIASTSRPTSAEDRVEFRLLPDVTVRLDNGSSVRGKLKSISPGSVVVLMKDESDKTISTDTVRMVNTSDGSIKYAPADGFESLAARVPRVQGATLQRDPTGESSATVEPSTGSAGSGGVGGPPAVFARSSGFSGPGIDAMVGKSGGIVAVDGFAGANQGPPKKMKLDTTAVASLMHNSSAASAEAEAATRPAPAPKGPLIGKPGETIQCANPLCRKMVTGARYGDQCPHCKVIWVAESAADVIAANGNGNGNGSGTQPVGGNPFGSGRSNTAVPATAANVQQTSPTVAVPQSFNLETVPWWGKAAGFAGLLAVLWFVSQRR